MSSKLAKFAMVGAVLAAALSVGRLVPSLGAQQSATTAIEALQKARVLERLAEALPADHKGSAPSFVLDPAWPKPLPHTGLSATSAESSWTGVTTSGFTIVPVRLAPPIAVHRVQGVRTRKAIRSAHSASGGRTASLLAAVLRRHRSSSSTKRGTCCRLGAGRPIQASSRTNAASRMGASGLRASTEFT